MTTDPIATRAQTAMDDGTADDGLDAEVVPYYAYIDAAAGTSHSHSPGEIHRRAFAFAAASTSTLNVNRGVNIGNKL